MKKSILSLGSIVSAGFLFGGCSDKLPLMEESAKETPKLERNYSFTNCDFSVSNRKLVRTASGIALGDIDGDGDLDIVVLYDNSSIRIYENKIPQKNLLERKQ